MIEKHQLELEKRKEELQLEMSDRRVASRDLLPTEQSHQLSGYSPSKGPAQV